MALWLLTPVFDHLDHPFWARSLNKEPVSVVADDEDQAKERAMAEGNNDNAVLRIPGVDAPLSPWKDPMLVHAEVIQFDLGPY